MNRLVDYVKPNPGAVSSYVFWVAGGIWIATLFMIWITGAAVFLPTPLQTIQKFPDLWLHEGLGVRLFDSFTLNLEAVGIMSVFSFFLAISTVMPLFRPLATLVASGRFNGFVGLPFVFMTILHNPHRVKVALLVFGMSVFTVRALVRMIESIPKEQFDHSRTLRMGEWRVVWEVIVLGRFDEVMDILQINIAMGWMMLPMVEGLFRFVGGIGTLMLNEEKHLNLDAVFCALFVILIIGLIQDGLLGKLKNTICPYVLQGMER